MKLDRLSPTQPAAVQSAGGGMHPATAPAPVGSAAGTEADRRRSLRQDLEEIEEKAVGEFEGQEQVLTQAHEVARQLAGLGPAADKLVRPVTPRTNWHAVDEQA